MTKVEIQTHIGGIPSIVVGYIHPEEGDNWHSPYIPRHVEDMEIFNMRRKPCKWREKRMTRDDFFRIEKEILEHERVREEYY